MPIPNAHSAFVPPEKLTGYLLNEEHPVGWSKAAWFHSLGYDSAVPAVLKADLLSLIQTSEDFTEKDSVFGKKYVVGGKMNTPSGVEVRLMTVWIAAPDDSRPRLVTAYPGEKS